MELQAMSSESRQKYMGLMNDGSDEDEPHKDDKPQRDDEETEEKDPMEINEFVERSGFGWFQVLHITLLGMIYMGDAAEMSLNAVILSTIGCDWKLTDNQQGSIPFVTLAVQCVGSVGGGLLSDRYGRRHMLLISLWSLLLFSILSALSPNYYAYTFLRGCVGICVGSNTGAAATYSLEIVPTAWRALTMFLLSTWWIIGNCYEYILGYFIMNQYTWKLQVLLTALPALISAIAVLFINESPRFSYIKGDVDSAGNAMKRMFRMNNEPFPPNKLYVHIEEKRGKLKDIFSSQFRWTTIILMQVFVINSAITYGQSFLMVGIFNTGYCKSPNQTLRTNSSNPCALTDQAYIKMSILASVCIPACLIGYLLADRVGRVRTVMIGAILILASLIPMFFCFGSIVIMIELSIFSFLVAFQNNALWTLMTEAYPTYVRNSAVGLINGSGKIGAGIGAGITQIIALHSIRTVVYVYIALTLYQIGSIFFFKIETMNAPLQDQREMAVIATTTSKQNLIDDDASEIN